jgi:hypothetical protein
MSYFRLDKSRLKTKVRLLPSCNGQPFYVHYCDGQRTVSCPGCPNPVQRHLFQIKDFSDGEIKLLFLPSTVAYKLIMGLTTPKPRQRNWFMRILEWIRVVKPMC